MAVQGKSWNSVSIASLPPELRSQALRSLTNEDAAALLSDWRFWARTEQLPPEGDWRIWLFLAGRGAGKTRAGAEWIAEAVSRGRSHHIGLVGATLAETRAVMVEGESGLLSVCPTAEFSPSCRRIRFRGGAEAVLLSADTPDKMRGFQFDTLWADEFCKWPDPQGALDMLLMGLRLGDPRMLITTTPRAIRPLRDLTEMADVVITRCATAANAANLAPGFLSSLEIRYGGTALARQELDGVIIEDNELALWQRIWISRNRCLQAPPLTRVVVAVDPPASIAADECGIIVAGVDDKGEGYVLADRSVGGLSPAGWAEKVALAYIAAEADMIVAEANQGGEMVRQVLLQALPNAPVKLVHAVRDKLTRACPAALLYEQGRVHHVGGLPELEDQMCQYDGSGKSPDRMDALVWALAELFAVRTVPRIRRL